MVQFNEKMIPVETEVKVGKYFLVRTKTKLITLKCTEMVKYYNGLRLTQKYWMHKRNIWIHKKYG